MRINSINPKRIIDLNSNNELDKFCLTLAVVYNDLKDLILIERLLSDKYAPHIKDGISFHSGEYGGLNTHITKLMASQVREFLLLLMKKQKLINSIEFKLILSKTKNAINLDWNDLNDIALNKNKNNTKLIQKLIAIRNNVSFHYDEEGDSLAESFKRFFFQREKIAQNERAYYSLGTTIENSRFFFADASVEEYLRSTIYSTGIGLPGPVSLDTELIDVIKKINMTLFHILSSYIKYKTNKTL